MAIAGLCVAVAAAVGFGFLFAAIQDLRRAGAAAANSRTLVAAANNLQTVVVQLQSSQRGYLLTDDRSFLVTYDRAAGRLDGAIAGLERAAAAAEPGTSSDVALIAAQARSYYEDWTQAVLELAGRDLEAARARVASGEGERRTRRIAALFAMLVAEENARAERSAAAADRSGRNATLLGAGVSAAILVLLALIVGYFARGVVLPVQRLAEASYRAAAGDLGARVREGGIGEAAALTARFNEMLAASERASEELQRQRAELEAVLDAVAEGITVTDAAGEVVFRNRPMDVLRAQLGVDDQGTIWSRLRSLSARPDEPESYPPSIEELASDPDAVVDDDFHLPHLQRSFRGFTAPVRAADGTLVGRVFSLRETTAERAAEQAKEEFLANVSHELRTPLTSIRGFIELLREGEAGELTRDQERFLTIVDQSARQLHALVDDLIVVGRTAEGRLDLDLAEADLSEIVTECIDSVRMAAEEKRVHLAIHAEPDVRLTGDRTRLIQLATNLIANAVKFTPAGGRVDVDVSQVDGSAVLTVADTGIGIPADEQEQLFERFFRASTAAHVPGSGLGLAISREIVRAHGGTIKVESSKGKGTTFRVELPLVGGYA